MILKKNRINQKSQHIGPIPVQKTEIIKKATINHNKQIVKILNLQHSNK